MVSVQVVYGHFIFNESFAHLNDINHLLSIILPIIPFIITLCPSNCLSEGVVCPSAVCVWKGDHGLSRQNYVNLSFFTSTSANYVENMLSYQILPSFLLKPLHCTIIVPVNVTVSFWILTKLVDLGITCYCICQHSLFISQISGRWYRFIEGKGRTQHFYLEK